MPNTNLLIDTQTFIWFVEDDPKLSAPARDIMEDKSNNLFVSIASLWEIVIKSSIGKLELKKDIPDVINSVSQNGFFILPIKPPHLITLLGLPYHHKDPFDRMIISQAITENMPTVSTDENFGAYKIVVIK